MKMTVLIREELEKYVTIEVDDNLSDEKTKEQARDKAIEKYNNSEIVLDADDHVRTFFFADSHEDEEREIEDFDGEEICSATNTAWKACNKKRMALIESENEYYKRRIKELEEMYDNMVAKKSKPATPKWIIEIRSVFKNVLKHNYIGDEALSNAFEYGDCLLACDGHRIICSAEHITDIPVSDNEAWASRLFKMMRNPGDDLEYKSYELPPLSVLKELEAKARANGPKGGKLAYIIKADNGMTAIDAKYLIDGMKATHSNKIRIAKPNVPATMQDGEEQFTTYMVLPICLRNPENYTEGLNWL